MFLAGDASWLVDGQLRSAGPTTPLSASAREQIAAIPILQLPPLPQRGFAYYYQPCFGIVTTLFLSVVLITVTSHFAAFPGMGPEASTLAVRLVWVWAAVAAVCVAWLVQGEAGVVRRGSETCYPIPEQVLRQLLSGHLPESAGNLPGLDGRSYCVRCLVWRPSGSHHCSICSRCVEGFDHHCDVFGRCIVRANMAPFCTLIFMALAGFFTATVTIMVAKSAAPAPVRLRAL